MGCLELDKEEYMKINESIFSGWKKVFSRETTTEEKIIEKNVSKDAGFTEEQLEQLRLIMNESKPLGHKRLRDGISIIATTVGLIGGIVAGILGITDVIGRFERMEENVQALLEDSSEMKEYLYIDGGVKDQLGDIYRELNMDAKVIEVDESTLVAFENVTIQSNNISHTTKAIEKGATIGIDNKGKKFYVEDLVEETVLLTYKENGNTVYFLGQYNENFNWDGYCVTNEYDKDGNLLGVCESTFANGVRKDYKTLRISNNDEKDAYVDSNEEMLKNNKWDYNERICRENYNEGFSIVYEIPYIECANFNENNVTGREILYTEDLIEYADTHMMQYYYGNTSNEEYNDDTGSAYFISFFESGHVKTLYCGNFVDGEFEDFTGDAWYITKEKDTDYMYYKGHFKDNGTVNNRGYKFENPVTINRIHEIIGDREFACEIEWGE